MPEAASEYWNWLGWALAGAFLLAVCAIGIWLCVRRRPDAIPLHAGEDILSSLPGIGETGVASCETLEPRDLIPHVERLFALETGDYAGDLRVFVVEMEACEIPSDLVPQDKLQGYGRLALIVQTDKHGHPRRIEHVVAYNHMGRDCAQLFGDKNVIELEP